MHEDLVGLYAIDYGTDLELRGSVEALETLAQQVRAVRPNTEFRTNLDVTGEGSSVGEGKRMVSIALKRRDSGPLRVSRQSATLVAEGGADGLDIFATALEVAASDAKTATDRAVMRHVHVEYLGVGDDAYRASDSVPLLVTAEWPD